MKTGYRRIFLGIVIMTLHVNIGNLEILPRFIGWAVVIAGIVSLKYSQSAEEYKKAEALAITGTLYSIITFITDLDGYLISSITMTLMILFISVIELLMEYFIIKGSADYLYDRGNPDYAHKLMKDIRVYATIDSITLFFFTLYYYEGFTIFVTICTIVFMILRIWFLVMIHGLKKYYSWSV